MPVAAVLDWFISLVRRGPIWIGLLLALIVHERASFFILAGTQNGNSFCKKGKTEDNTCLSSWQLNRTIVADCPTTEHNTTTTWQGASKQATELFSCCNNSLSLSSSHLLIWPIHSSPSLLFALLSGNYQKIIEILAQSLCDDKGTIIITLGRNKPRIGQCFCCFEDDSQWVLPWWIVMHWRS